MGQIDLGRVQGHSITKIVKIASTENVDTYEVRLDDNTVAGQFTVTNGLNGTNGVNGKDGKDGAPGKDGTLISVDGKLVETFNADTKADIPVDSLSSSETKKPLSANMGRKLDMIKAPTDHASADTMYGISSSQKYGHSIASSTLPLVNGTANPGVDNGKYAREGHVHPTDMSRAAASHKHSASDINSGILTVDRGGTGRGTFGFGEVLIGNGSGTISTISQSSMSVGSARKADVATQADKATNAIRANTADSATTANRAIYDSNGNNIVNTYLGTSTTVLLGPDYTIGGDGRTVSISGNFSNYKYIIFAARDVTSGSNIDYSYCMVERKLLQNRFNSSSRPLAITRDGARLKLYYSSNTAVYVISRHYNNLLTIYGVN